MSNFDYKQNGMTLIETLVALFVLSIALTGAFTMIVSNLANAKAAQNSFIASGLAQEGIEVVRNLRDSDWLASPQREFGSLGSFAGPLADGIYCLEWNSVELIDFGCDSTLYKSATGVYQYDIGGTPTPFRRTVAITRSGDEIVVVVTVSWSDRSRAKQIQAETHLYNWY